MQRTDSEEKARDNMIMSFGGDRQTEGIKTFCQKVEEAENNGQEPIIYEG